MARHGTLVHAGLLGMTMLFFGACSQLHPPDGFHEVPAPRLEGSWVPFQGCDTVPDAVCLVQSLLLDERLWSGLSLNAGCLVLRYDEGSAPSSLWALGRCGWPAVVSLRSDEDLAAWLVEQHSIYDFVPGERLQLPAALAVVVTNRNRHVTVDDRQFVRTAIHEFFHGTIQADLPPPMTIENAWLARKLAETGSRQYLVDEYERIDSIRDLQRRERSHLLGALGSLAKTPRDCHAAAAHLEAFIAVRQERRGDDRTPIGAEDYWEMVEGIPNNLETRLARQLGWEDDGLIGRLLRGETTGTEAVPSFVVLGSLQAAILDESKGWQPSRPLAARSLFASLSEAARRMRKDGC